MGDEPKADVKTPVVFVSYSWTTPEHEQWVLELAKRLMSDGVDVVLDKWLLKVGHDKFAFMEQILKPEISHVLSICDKKYMERANSRAAGVGVESQIITQESYAKVDHGKFIPIVREYDDGKACLPTFYGGRIYIDMSTPEKANSGYETLLRAVFDKPLHVKPSVGSPPPFILTPDRKPSRSYSKLALFKDAVMNDRRPLLRGLLRAYLDTYEHGIAEYVLDREERNVPFDEQVYSSIMNFLPYRDEMIDALAFVYEFTEDPKLDSEVREFFERALLLKQPKDGLRDKFFDNIAFVVYELFLYWITVMIKTKRYEEVRTVLSETYFHDDQGYSDSFRAFYCYPESIESDRNQRLGTRRISVSADLLRDRSTIPEMPFQLLMQTDLILFCRSTISGDKTQAGLIFPQRWYPRTFVFGRHHQQPYPLFIRASKDFGPLGAILGVTNVNDFVAKLKAGLQKQAALGGYDEVLMNARYILEEIAGRLTGK